MLNKHSVSKNKRCCLNLHKRRKMCLRNEWDYTSVGRWNVGSSLDDARIPRNWREGNLAARQGGNMSLRNSWHEMHAAHTQKICRRRWSEAIWTKLQEHKRTFTMHCSELGRKKTNLLICFSLKCEFWEKDRRSMSRLSEQITEIIAH